MRLLRPKSRRQSIFLLASAASLLLIVGGALYSRVPAQDTSNETEIAPGLKLLSVTASSPTGMQRYFLVTAQKASWKLGLEVANRNDVMKKRSARNLATQAEATVAVNGGFFAYGGAAVGAVKSSGEWLRLPWKSRTALGWDENDATLQPRIGALQGKCLLTLDIPKGPSQTFEASLNGFSLPGSHANQTDGFAVLTRRFGPKVKISADQSAFLVQGGKVVQRGLAGEIAVPEDAPDAPYLIIARGNSAALLSGDNGATAARWTIPTLPQEWASYPTILGAGPMLVDNGLVRTTEVAEEFRPDVVAAGPRTCVGWNAQGDWLLLVADGRQQNAIGFTIPEIARLFQQLGAVQAMNLDGGSSTQLVINGNLVNTPSGFDPVNPLRPREVQVSNALVFKSLAPPAAPPVLPPATTP